LSFLVTRWKISGKLAEWTERQFDLYFIALYAACHFLFFFTAFFILHQKPWADLIFVYVPQAHAVMHGLFPYRDFPSSYAPLNPYLDALILKVHDSALSILFFQIVCDILSVPFWIRFLRRFMNERTVRLCFISCSRWWPGKFASTARTREWFRSCSELHSVRLRGGRLFRDYP